MELVNAQYARRLILAFAAVLAVLLSPLTAQARSEQTTGERARSEQVIEGPWRSILFETGPEGGVAADADIAFQQAAFDDSDWQRVEVPHNWQGYAYARQVRNGSLHGSALYRKVLTLAAPAADERIALRFEGVSAYATVWLNGIPVGRHGGGLVGFTLDVTDAVRDGANLLAVRADMPKGIEDLPWAPGDDQPENGFSEGSQPLGIFRPVHVVRTNALHIAPFGIYAWGGLDDIDAQSARLTARTEIANVSGRSRVFTVLAQMVAPDGTVAAETRSRQSLAAGAEGQFDMALPVIANPQLWSPDRPVLYRLRSSIMADGRLIDRQETDYGIRTAELRADAAGGRRLFVNGQPVFLRGVAEYEHLLGNSHAFTGAQVDARIEQAKAAGFNAFRDAHVPHNLRYGDKIAAEGLMWWPQFSAHNWFDNPAYRANFKRLLAQWVRERRNNPANFMWGLQNESQIPAEFAQEAMAIIRALDPTASVQRLIVTCNGGEGTDWNVPQNWSGTYGGDPDQYAAELAKQGLVGEYGAWRSLGLHGEASDDPDVWTEGRMAALMQKKARLADSVADRAVGHFQWLLTTHENPGRPMRGDGTQIFDGIRPLDHVGPANNKGLMTLWGEPIDAFYMYRARQVAGSAQPFAYIVSHTWPDRWTGPGIKSGIEVYSNCDTVELFNDASGSLSLGRRRPDAEQRFVWNGVAVSYNVLLARCFMGGKAVHEDRVVLNNLPAAPDAAALVRDPAPVTAAETGRHYLYRVNVGGKGFADADGQLWQGDRHFVEGADWGWTSWADRWSAIEPALGSRRITHDPVEGAREQALFQSFRYGRGDLRYRFAVPDGRYRVTLYFVEPWYGRAAIDARGWRRFDVAVNDRVAIRDLDIFAEAGFGHALVRTVDADITGGWLTVHFPRVAAGQAILSGIAISSDRAVTNAQPLASDPQGTDLISSVAGGVATRFLDNGDPVFASGAERWTGLPFTLLDRDFVQPDPAGTASASVTLRIRSELYLALRTGEAAPQGWQESELGAAMARVGGNGTTITPLRFVMRTAEAGETVALPSDKPLIVKRLLPSPYAPGNFTFAKNRGLHEAESEKAERRNAGIASVVQGYGGQGYAVMGTGEAGIAWDVSTGIAGKHGFRLRYQLPEGAAARSATLVLRDSSGIDMARVTLELTAGEGWQEADGSTASAVNAGDYRLRLIVPEGDGLLVDSVTMD